MGKFHCTYHRREVKGEFVGRDGGARLTSFAHNLIEGKVQNVGCCVVTHTLSAMFLERLNNDKSVWKIIITMLDI